MSDLRKYCVHLLGKEGLGPVRGGFPFQIILYMYRAVMEVGVGTLHNIGDFPILYFVLQLAINVCLILYVSYPQSLR